VNAPVEDRDDAHAAELDVVRFESLVDQLRLQGGKLGPGFELRTRRARDERNGGLESRARRRLHQPPHRRTDGIEVRPLLLPAFLRFRDCVLNHGDECFSGERQVCEALRRGPAQRIRTNGEHTAVSRLDESARTLRSLIELAGEFCRNVDRGHVGTTG